MLLIYHGQKGIQQLLLLPHIYITVERHSPDVLRAHRFDRELSDFGPAFFVNDLEIAQTHKTVRVLALESV